MRKLTERFLIILVAVTMVVGLMSGSVSAAGYKDILILGDSISTGYGLSGTLYERASYANKLYTALEGDGILNLAVDGATSGDLLTSLEHITDKIKNKDLIVMSIGGNDLLRASGKILAKAFDMPEGTELSLLLEKLAASDTATVAGIFTTEYSKTQFASMLATLNVNVSSIFSALKIINPEAKIIVLNQYNPFSGVTSTPAMIAFDTVSNSVIEALNGVISTCAENNGVEVCDTYSAFNGQGALYTRILSMDIHPNEAGHALIFDLLYDMMELDTPETSDTVIGCVVGLMLSAAGVVTFYSKKKLGENR